MGVHSSEYLRRGIEDIRAAAAFVFRRDAKRLGRYPTLAFGKKKRMADDSEEEAKTDEISSSQTQEVEAQTSGLTPSLPEVTPQSPSVS